MNTSQYMDKQIMDLSNSQNNNNDFIDLVNPQVDHHISGDPKKEDIVPSYEFHPIRPIGSSSPKSNVDSSNVGAAARAWNSADSKNNTESSIRVIPNAFSISICNFACIHLFVINSEADLRFDLLGTDYCNNGLFMWAN